jgi:ankyrin repeat protein
MDTTTFLDLVRAGDAPAVAAALATNPGLALARTPEGISATLYAAYCHQPEVLRLVAAQNPHPDIFETAVLGQFDAAEQWLLQDPGLANAESADGFTPLGLASYFGQIDVVRLLIAYGADVNQPANNGSQVAPLHSAVAAGSHEVADFLLQHDAYPNAQQAGGHTPLHSAAHRGRTDLVELLLLYGADPHLPNEAGQTPADLAREAGFGDLAGLLDQLPGDGASGGW